MRRAHLFFNQHVSSMCLANPGVQTGRLILETYCHQYRLMTSGWAISLDDGAGQYERIGIHCVRFKQWIIYGLLEATAGLVWRGMTAAG